MAAFQSATQHPRLGFIICSSALLLFVLFSPQALRGRRREEQRHQRDILDSTEIPAEHIDPAAIDLTPLVNTLINTSQSGSRQLFSLLSVTSYSSLALHKLTLLVYNISSIKSIESNKFRRRFCYCVTNDTNDLTDFTAILLDVMGNSTSYLHELFKSASILSVSQRNNSDCIFICVMAGKTGREVPELWEVDAITPLFNQTIVEGPHRGNVSSIRLPAEWHQLPTNLSHVSPSGMSSVLTSRVHATAHVSPPALGETVAAPAKITTAQRAATTTVQPGRTTAGRRETTVTTRPATTVRAEAAEAAEGSEGSELSTTKTLQPVMATEPNTILRGTAAATATAPSTTATVPSTTATAPSTTATAPSTTATAPSTTATAPSTTATVPSTTATAPSTTATIPSTTATIPSTTATIPSTTRTAPSTTATAPSTTTTIPSTLATIPSTTATAPSTTATAPSTTATAPSTTATAPSTTATVPSTTATIPSTTATILYTTATAPHTTATVRFTTATVSSTTSAAPGTLSPGVSQPRPPAAVTPHITAVAPTTKLPPVRPTAAPTEGRRTTGPLGRRTTTPSRPVETERPGCPWRRPELTAAASPPGRTTTVSAHKLQPCVLELCKFFSQCLCRPFGRRTRMKRYCDDSHVWYEQHTSEVCRRVRRVSFSRNLKQRCLTKMCSKL